jgi:hypothetical protein
MAQKTEDRALPDRDLLFGQFGPNALRVAMLTLPLRRCDRGCITTPNYGTIIVSVVRAAPRGGQGR